MHNIILVLDVHRVLALIILPHSMTFLLYLVHFISIFINVLMLKTFFKLNFTAV